MNLKSYENPGGKSMANIETNLKTEFSQTENNNTKVARDYKSRLFSYLFGREETKDRTLSLYNSLNKTHYTDPEDITITTIEDVIYMGMKNDLSYIVSDRSSLYDVLNINEHQSTYGHSKEVLSECKALNEYAWLVEQIRRT